jgi:hypothetical protein
MHHQEFKPHAFSAPASSKCSKRSRCRASHWALPTVTGYRHSNFPIPQLICSTLRTLEETQTRQQFQNTFDQLVISGNFTLSLCTFGNGDVKDRFWSTSALKMLQNHLPDTESMSSFKLILEKCKETGTVITAIL